MHRRNNKFTWGTLPSIFNPPSASSTGDEDSTESLLAEAQDVEFHFGRNSLSEMGHYITDVIRNAAPIHPHQRPFHQLLEMKGQQILRQIRVSRLVLRLRLRLGILSSFISS